MDAYELKAAREHIADARRSGNPASLSLAAVCEWLIQQIELPSLPEAVAGNASAPVGEPQREMTIQQFAAELYQVCGVLNAPAPVLDQLSAAAQGKPLPYTTLLPFHGPLVDKALAGQPSGVGEPRKLVEKWRKQAANISKLFPVSAEVQNMGKSCTEHADELEAALAAREVGEGLREALEIARHALKNGSTLDDRYRAYIAVKAALAPAPFHGDEPSCSNCGHGYAQHTKGINHPQKYCRHCPCPEWAAPTPSSINPNNPEFRAGDGYGMSRVFQQLEQYLETGTCECEQVIEFAVRLEGKFRAPKPDEPLETTTGVNLSVARYNELIKAEQDKGFLAEALERVYALPGVRKLALDEAAPAERDKPNNLQAEPSYPNHETVIMSMRSPDWTIHHKSARCEKDWPHETKTCAEWAAPKPAPPDEPTDRQFAYRFLELPHHEQWALAKQYGVFSESDADMPDSELFVIWIKRLRERGKLEEFKVEIVRRAAERKPPR